MTPGVDVVLAVTASPAATELAAIGDPLTAFNTAHVGASDRQVLAVIIRDDAGSGIGGLAGHTAWGWLYVQWLYVPEPLRGRGLAGRLLATAEIEALARGCTGAWIDTFSDRALRAYQRQGYAIFGELPDFPAGRTRWFLRKRLGGAGAVTPANAVTPA